LRGIKASAKLFNLLLDGVVGGFASNERIHPAEAIPQLIDFRRKLPKERCRRSRIIPIEQFPL
jgi:hypothetical protein